MIEPARSMVVGAAVGRPRCPIPGSTAWIEVAAALPAGGEEILKFHVRCGHCDKRLLDIVNEAGSGSGSVLPDSVAIERKCPSCRLINAHRVTAIDGRPLEGAAHATDSWRCAACGRSLGKIDHIRGRVHVRCRCNQEARVIAGSAVAVIDKTFMM
jgi:phage FluMu protein Com